MRGLRNNLVCGLNMTVEYIEYKGIEYPVRLVYFMNVEFKGQCENVYIAPYELWLAIEDDYEDGVAEAIEIDNSIYFYCNGGFLDREPTDEEIIEYVKENI